MEKNDGGPAFPAVRISYGTGLAGSDERVYVHGMSLRDWFAGQALNALLACDDTGNMRTFEHYANNAYSFADAMLKEREK